LDWFARADLAGGIHRVLLLHCGDDVRHSEAELREFDQAFTQSRIAYDRADTCTFPFPARVSVIEEIDVAVIGEKVPS